MLKPDMTALLTNHSVPKSFQHTNQTFPRIRRAVVSRSLDWYELVLYIMQLDQPRLHR
jgi:hypothetical protein